VNLKNLLSRRIITSLINQAILDGLSDRQVRQRLLACGYSVDMARIKARRKYLQERSVPV
jgi:hypothetical protein